MSVTMKKCQHLIDLKSLSEKKDYVCEECTKNGADWVHLRTCQTCGITLCCDSSPNKHATKHYRETGHPVISSAEPGEKWLWCYADELYLPY